MVEEDGGILGGCDVGVVSRTGDEITTTAIDLEFLPIVTNVEGGVRNLELVLQQMHSALMALRLFEANGHGRQRGRILSRHGEDCRNVLFRRQVKGNETC